MSTTSERVGDHALWADTTLRTAVGSIADKGEAITMDVVFARGERVGPFELVDLLTKGRATDVWRATRAGPALEPLALHRLRDVYERWRPAFWDTLKKLSGLDHPNLLRVYPPERLFEEPIGVVELADGPSVFQLRAAKLPIPETTKVALILEWTRALRAIEAQTGAITCALSLADLFVVRGGAVRYCALSFSTGAPRKRKVSTVLLDALADLVADDTTFGLEEEALPVSLPPAQRSIHAFLRRARFRPAPLSLERLEVELMELYLKDLCGPIDPSVLFEDLLSAWSRWPKGKSEDPTEGMGAVTVPEDEGDDGSFSDCETVVVMPDRIHKKARPGFVEDEDAAAPTDRKRPAPPERVVTRRPERRPAPRVPGRRRPHARPLFLSPRPLMAKMARFSSHRGVWYAFGFLSGVAAAIPIFRGLFTMALCFGPGGS